MRRDIIKKINKYNKKKIVHEDIAIFKKFFLFSLLSTVGLENDNVPVKSIDIAPHLRSLTHATNVAEGI